MADLIIYPYRSLEMDQFRISKITRNTSGGRSILKGTVTYQQKNILITGPKLTLGSEIIKQGEYYYIDLILNENEPNDRYFIQLMHDIDAVLVGDVYQNSKVWYREDISLTQLEQEYIQTIKYSTIYKNHLTMKIKMPADCVEFFDQDNVVVPHQIIKEKYKVIPLLRLACVYKDHKNVWAGWEIPQLKVIIPNNIFKTCQLVDDTESEIDVDVNGDVDGGVDEGVDRNVDGDEDGEEIITEHGLGW
jgi:hypothetical protein